MSAWCRILRRQVRPKALESFIVGFVVDVEKNSIVLNLHLDDPIQVAPEDRAAADVSAEGHDLGED